MYVKLDVPPSVRLSSVIFTVGLKSSGSIVNTKSCTSTSPSSAVRVLVNVKSPADGLTNKSSNVNDMLYASAMKSPSSGTSVEILIPVAVFEITKPPAMEPIG